MSKLDQDLMFDLEEHEVIRWSSHDVDVKLNGTSGTNVRLGQAHIRLTNRYIHIAPSQSVTYNVVQKGDRNFRTLRIPVLAAKPHRFIQPWFGPYKWETGIQLPHIPELEPQDDQWTLTLVFSNGGAFEYRANFLRTFSDCSQAASIGIDEVLPAYSAT